MPTQLIMSVLSDDKPGIVRQIADIVAAHQGNWLESQLSHLAGKFTGLVCVSVAEEQRQSLESALQSLSAQGIVIQAETLSSPGELDQEAKRKAYFSAMGPDRPGIVLEISQAFSHYQINLEDLHTQCSSMPYTGDPLFEAEGCIGIPSNTDINELQDRLEQIAETLGMDIRLSEGDE